MITFEKFKNLWVETPGNLRIYTKPHLRELYSFNMVQGNLLCHAIPRKPMVIISGLDRDLVIPFAYENYKENHELFLPLGLALEA